MVDSHFNLIYDILPAMPKKKSEDKPKLEKRLNAEKGNDEPEEKPKEELPKGIKKRDKKLVRKVGSEQWVDPTLDDWPANDFRIFCGNMGNEVNDEVLANAFKKYPSFNKARIVRDKKTLKSKGFGFVSL